MYRLLILLGFLNSLRADGFFDSDGNFFYEDIDFLTPEDRVSNGQTANLGQFPYHAKLDLKNSEGRYFRCGGSLIASEWIVTAAHCLNNGIVSARAVLGRVNLRNRTQGKTYHSDDLIVHQDFDPDTLENDIALIHLDESVETDENIAIIDLPEDDGDDYVGDVFTVTGFGRLGRNKPLSNTLQYTNLKVRPNRICQRLYNSEDFDDTKLCCKGKDGESTCSGDSGGPLADVNYSNNRNRLIGLVSFGKGSCEGKNPSGFTKVAAYLDWLSEQMEVGNFKEPC
ncbi:hypothetical protein ACFFRR_002984 [Megaselia abdita]